MRIFARGALLFWCWVFWMFELQNFQNILIRDEKNPIFLWAGLGFWVLFKKTVKTHILVGFLMLSNFFWKWMIVNELWFIALSIQCCSVWFINFHQRTIFINYAFVLKYATYAHFILVGRHSPVSQSLRLVLSVSAYVCTRGESRCADGLLCTPGCAQICVFVLCLK